MIHIFKKYVIEQKHGIQAHRKYQWSSFDSSEVLKISVTVRIMEGALTAGPLGDMYNAGP